MAVLEKAVADFGVTRWQLGQLLGASGPSQVYRWLGGRERPSSKYVVRLVALYQLHEEGAVLSKVRAIDWQKAAIIFRGASTKGTRPLARPAFKGRG